MKNTLNEVNLEEMLAAREQRVAKQQKLLKTYKQTLICFTMNIPGPIKVNHLVKSGFELGCYRLEKILSTANYPVLAQEKTWEKTGLEAYYVIGKDSLAVKKLMVELESQDALGRLFDIDVLKPDGSKVSREEIGLPGRLCLLCDKLAQECARSRTHTVVDLMKHVQQVLEDSLLDTVAQCCRQALQAEADATPKPGLVDRDNPGAHKDMNHNTFNKSIVAITPYFRQMAKVGLHWDGNGQALFKEIRPLGSAAEKAMFQATGNVNTHKGIIFSLGLMVTFALWYYREKGTFDPEAIMELCGKETKYILNQDFAGIDKAHPKTHGEKLYVQYGFTGIRGEAMAGFPAVRKIGLPTIKKLSKQEQDAEKVHIQTLLTLLENVEDSNILIRTNAEMLKYARTQAKNILALGGAFTDTGLNAIWNLNEDFIQKNLSPGGTADLLISTIFWQRLTTIYNA